MALHLHRAERTDLLADGLGALLADPQPDPFAQELVLVAARGVERWLSQRLSLVLGCGPGRADGVCAGIAFRNPQSLIAEITGTLDDDPWSPEALAWPLLAVIDASLDEPWCRTLASHLGHFATTDAEAELRRGRRYSVARRLAGLFASYARQRPGLLAAWLDGDLGELPGDLAWQPPLWRALVTTVGADPPHVRHDKTIARLRDGPADLPARLSLFGHTRLACTDVQLLDALAVHHDLHLWLPHPSDELWRALAGFQGADGLLPRRQDTSRRAAQHPLLETLGRDVRELQRALPAARATDEFLGATTKPDTLLGWLQADIAGNAPRPAGRSLSDADRSVQVHACHGPARQIDVLREVLLGLLEDDPTLQPRDIVVMCPDIDTYAPLIVAGFGLGEVAGDCHPAHRLRVRLADRALTQTNPLLSVAAELLTIAETRATASQLLNLAQAAPVRAKFGFADDDLDTITTWVRESNIRWGFDPTHRRRYGLDTVVHNTWRFGLDRILTGVAMSEDSQAWLDTALPLDDVGSNRVELAGRLAEFVERLHHVVGGLSGARPLVAWLDALATGRSARRSWRQTRSPTPMRCWRCGSTGRICRWIMATRPASSFPHCPVCTTRNGSLASNSTRGEMFDIATRFKNSYGSGPLHLLAMVSGFALLGYIVATARPSALWNQATWWQSIAVWFVAAVVAHDLLLYPLYALADRILARLVGRRDVSAPRRRPELPVRNYIRIPALAAGLTLLVFLPGIIRQGAPTYLDATGQTQEPFLGRWLLLTAVAFGISAAAYAIRLVVAHVRRRRAGCSRVDAIDEE